MNSKIILILGLFVLLGSKCDIGADLHDDGSAISIDDLRCMKNSLFLDFSFIFVRVTLNSGVVDPHALETLRNAATVGIYADTYMELCYTKNPETQVD